MITYERGKAPADAPLDWEYEPHEGCVVTLESGHVIYGLHADDADLLCRGAHLVRLSQAAAETAETADGPANPRQAAG